MVENLKDVVFQIDQEGCWAYLNPAWETITGFSTGDALGAHFQGYVLPEDRKKITTLFNQLKDQVQAEARVEVRFISKTKKFIWVDILMIRLSDPGAFIIGSLHDVTLAMDNERRLHTANKMVVEGLQREQTMSEEYQLLNKKLLKNEAALEHKTAEVSELNLKLKEQTEKTKEQATLLELSGDLIAVADNDGYFLQINLAWQQTIGFSEEELLKKSFLELVHPDDKEKNLKNTQSLKKGNFEFIGFVNRCQTKSGTYRWLSWNSKSSADGKRIYIVARDITSQKQGEE